MVRTKRKLKNEIARFRAIKRRNLAISSLPVRQKQIHDQCANLCSRTTNRPDKNHGDLGRCNLKGPVGDSANAILTAVGPNLCLILVWLRILLCPILAALWHRLAIHSAPNCDF
jgi:hypothetical protein